MNCPEFESILADYLDGTLSKTERAAIELHAAECPACGVFMAEVTQGVSLLETFEAVEPPPELITRLAFHSPVGRVRDPYERQTLWNRFTLKWLQPLLQPKFVMGAAMMVLSFTMLERCTGTRVERVQSADLNPVRVWGGMEMKTVRMKDRMLKYYENLRVVYEVEARVRDLQRQQDDNDKAAAHATPTPGAAAQTQTSASASDARGQTMNCYLHQETPATAFCRDCGRALCPACQHPHNGTIFCQEHAPMTSTFTAPPDPVAQASNPYQQAATHPRTSPALAFLLGLIPGVGAIYNGQYAKGLVHAAIIGLLISLLSSIGGSGGEVFVAMMLVGFYSYMAFEAFHTAKKRQAGVPLDEFSSLIAPGIYRSRAPIGPLLLIILGVLFLLDTMHLIAFRELARFWPLLLIAVGAFMLYNRVSGIQHARHALEQPLESESSREQ